jgi:hypothetical protein
LEEVQPVSISTTSRLVIKLENNFGRRIVISPITNRPSLLMIKALLDVHIKPSLCDGHLISEC